MGSPKSPGYAHLTCDCPSCMYGIVTTTLSLWAFPSTPRCRGFRYFLISQVLWKLSCHWFPVPTLAAQCRSGILLIAQYKPRMRFKFSGPAVAKGVSSEEQSSLSVAPPPSWPRQLWGFPPLLSWKVSGGFWAQKRNPLIYGKRLAWLWWGRLFFPLFTVSAINQAAIWEAVSLFLRTSPLCQIHGSQNVSDNELDVILVCQAAITKCRRPGGLKNRSLFSHSSRD